MRKVLVPIDGSENALRALRHVLAELQGWREATIIVLLNVQPPIVSGAIRTFVPHDQIEDFHRQAGEAALAPARALAEEASAPFECHTLVGDAATSIARYASEHACALVAMGTRGLGSVSGMLLGSVATKVVHLSEGPVLLVK